MSKKTKWSTQDIANKLDYEGLDYIATQIFPEDIEDQTLAFAISILKMARENLHNLLPEPSEEN